MRGLKNIFLILCVTFLSKTYAQLPYFTRYNTVQGLAGNLCYDLLQDRYGFIWAATSSGISRFDGTYFENFTVDNGLPENEVLKIFEDSKGRIWFLTLSGSIGYIENNKIFSSHNSPILAKITSKSVGSTIFEDRQKRIWASYSDGKIYCIDQTNVYHYSVPELSNAIFFQDHKNEIFAQSLRYTFRWNGQKFEPELTNESGSDFLAITSKDSRSTLLLDKNRNVSLFENKKCRPIFSVIPSDLDIDSKIFHTTVNSKDVGVWITKKTGVKYVSKNFTSSRFLSGVGVNKVIRSVDKNYWFATNDGVYLLPNQDERYYIFNKENNEIWSNHVSCIYIDKMKRIWLGYEDGVVDVFFDNTLLKRFHLWSEQQPTQSLKQFCFDESKDRLFVISDFSMFYFEDLSSNQLDFKKVKISEVGNSAVKQISISKNYIALATSSGVYLLRKNKLNVNHFLNGVVAFRHSGRAFSVYLDQNEHLWFTDLDGISEYIQGKLIAHYSENTLLSKRINDIKTLKNGVKLLATDGNGLLFYQNGKIIHQLNQLNGLSSNICQKIFVKNDTIWVQTAKGCNFIIQKDNKFSIRNLNFIHAEIADKLTDIFIDPYKNSGYLSSDKGLIAFVSKLSDKQQNTPRVYIRNVRINGANVNIDSSIKLQSFKTNMTVQFAAISYNNASIGYKYKLNDNNWIETNVAKIEYASLLPGKYQLFISANKNNEEWSEPAVVQFEISAPFWWQWWFIGVILLLFLVLMYYVIRSVMQRQRNREKNELMVQNKILALEQQALQAMMNPHFVFNVMNTIQHFINTKDNAGANRMLTGFARLIRKNLDICTKSKISIEEEIGYLELYLKLEKMRFGDKMDYFIEVDPDIIAKDTLIPSMLLQPFVENSVWHGILPMETNGTIYIKIKTLDDDKSIKIEIEDNGVGIDNSRKNSRSSHVSKGMQITKERIALMEQIEKKAIHLQIKQTGAAGTKVELVFPI